MTTHTALNVMKTYLQITAMNAAKLLGLTPRYEFSEKEQNRIKFLVVGPLLQGEALA